jgi:16S rRNA (guanine966-N2)-methyltransferase
VRITGGISRGRKLAQLKGPNLRPTADKVRGAVFNMLGQDLTGWRVLDLFAGTGAFGIDAISRGAATVVFVDYSKHAVELIKRNISICGFEQKALVVKADLRSDIAFGKCEAQFDFFDVAFLDPPYESGLIPRVCRMLTVRGLLRPNAWVIAETARNESLPGLIQGLIPVQEKIYGDTKISIFFYEDELRG